MTITERLAQAQEHERRIAEQIDSYQREIQRLTPQLWATQGQIALLMELSQEDTYAATHADPTPAE